MRANRVEQTLRICDLQQSVRLYLQDINSRPNVAKGEAMEYSTSIIREFKQEFKHAELVVSYDIACRMTSSIAAAQLTVTDKFVPILHSYCHNLKCRMKYSPSFKFGIGLEDGENCERWWSRMNWNSNLAFMRPENRPDFISALVDGRNKAAYSELVRTLRLKLKKAKLILESKNLPRDFEYVRMNLAREKAKYQAIETSQKFSRESFLETIFDICYIVNDLRIKQRAKKGTKSTAMIARAITSTLNDISKLIENYNTSFNLNLTESEAFAGANTDRFNSGLAGEIRFWKACEQVLMTLDDIKVAIDRLEHLVVELEIMISRSRENHVDYLTKRRFSFGKLYKSLILSWNLGKL